MSNKKKLRAKRVPLTSTEALSDAREATREERAAVAPAKDNAVLNVEVSRAASIAMTSFLRIEPMLPELKRSVPELDVALVKTIPVKAEALIQAKGDYRVASVRENPLPDLDAEAVQLRADLLAELTHAARRGTIPEGRLSDISQARSYRDVADDLVALTSLARSEEPALRGKWSFTPSAIERAEKVAAGMWHAIAERDARSHEKALAKEELRRAFTLLDDAYDHARRAIAYVRWSENDLQVVAPSLRTNSGVRRRSSSADESDASAGAASNVVLGSE